jgi:hypothetical protein
VATLVFEMDFPVTIAIAFAMAVSVEPRSSISLASRVFGVSLAVASVISFKLFCKCISMDA